jgi:hypothetical protein
MVDVDDLAKHLGFSSTPADAEVLERALRTSHALIRPHLRVDLPDPLGDEQQAALDLALLTVAGDVWRRKDAPGGVYMYPDLADMSAVLPRDPLAAVWSWLVEAQLVKAVVVA